MFIFSVISYNIIHANIYIYTYILRPSWSYGSWIYIYLCNQCLSPLKLLVWILLRRGVLDTTLCDKVCQWIATGQWFSLGTPVSSTNKTDCHETEILLKVILNTINQTKPISLIIDFFRKCYSFCKYIGRTKYGGRCLFHSTFPVKINECPKSFFYNHS